MRETQTETAFFSAPSLWLLHQETLLKEKFLFHGAGSANIGLMRLLHYEARHPATWGGEDFVLVRDMGRLGGFGWKTWMTVWVD